MMLLHLLSPVFYALFVRALQCVPPCPNSGTMLLWRVSHNLFMAAISLVMLVGVTYGAIVESKFGSISAMLCTHYQPDGVAAWTYHLFLWSKYVEWADTAFLHLSGKPISTLQYTHHMSTAILVYLNLMDYVSPHIYIFASLNTLVHIPMYWYFAYPDGQLRRVRSLITCAQISQHLICLGTIMYTYSLDECAQNRYGNQVGLLLYAMYAFYFIRFYCSMI